jgi:nitrite reductase/ring-hydroxylating ferredoxin subunit
MTAPQQHTALPIPNGWFPVSWSRDLGEGEVKRAYCFGRELVLFRTRLGKPAVLDAYCSHLGAHLAVGGRVVGESIRCPFHGWQYDASGQCVAIPHCKAIPPKARVRSWDVVERNGLVFAWYHAEGKPPDWEVPAVEEIGHPDWTPPRTLDIDVPIHMQELAENNNDPAHFEFVHGAPELPPSEIEYAENGRFYRMTSRGTREAPGGPIEFDLVRDTFGLGIATVRLEISPEVGFLLLSCTTPIDERSSRMRWSLTVTKNAIDLGGEDFMQGIVQGVEQDVPIWTNKIYREQPVLCETDQYIAEFRRWTKQFYSPTA